MDRWYIVDDNDNDYDIEQYVQLDEAKLMMNMFLYVNK